MVGEAAEKKLYDAATKGDVSTFQEMVQQDPYLLDVVSFACAGNLLHVATIWGQAFIVEEVLNINPKLARNLDSQQSSPLHIAAAQGNIVIVRKLLSVAREACWWRDCHDMNPIHIAAMNGHYEVLKMLLEESHMPAMEMTGHRGQTVLHLCVKYGQLRALVVLMNRFKDLVRAKDENGETILHLAVRCNQLEIIRFLVENNIRGMESKNSMGKTPLQIFNEINNRENHSEIKKILIKADGSRWQFLYYRDKSKHEFHKKKREQIMVVMVLIATMAFQAAVSPPGGVWQDETPSHKMGEAVMATTHPKVYKHFIRANNTAFVSSVVAILLLYSGLLSVVVVPATVLVWVSLASISVSYAGSVLVTTPNTETQPLSKIINAVIAAIFSLCGFNLLLLRLREKWSSSLKTIPQLPEPTADSSTATDV